MIDTLIGRNTIITIDTLIGRNTIITIDTLIGRNTVITIDTLIGRNTIITISSYPFTPTSIHPPPLLFCLSPLHPPTHTLDPHPHRHAYTYANTHTCLLAPQKLVMSLKHFSTFLEYTIKLNKTISFPSQIKGYDWSHLLVITSCCTNLICPSCCMNLICFVLLHTAHTSFALNYFMLHESHLPLITQHKSHLPLITSCCTSLICP